MKFFKNIVSYLIIIIFIAGFFYYFVNNKTDFYFLTKIKINILVVIIFLCLIYLITETLIFKLILNFYNKHGKISDCFLVICTTYLFNTFIQFSGLGYRAYYLKKFKNIEVKNFIILSIFIMLIELSIFSFLSFILISFFDKINVLIGINKFIYYILIIIFIFSLINIFFYKKILFLIKGFKIIKKYKILSLFFYYLSYFNSKKLMKLFKYFCLLFVFQFIILFLIFFISISILNQDNTILFALLTTISIDLSFIFSLTPNSIGISEMMIFFSSNNLNIKFSEILYLTNIFRICMFLIYSIFGILNLYIFTKKNLNIYER